MHATEGVTSRRAACKGRLACLHCLGTLQGLLERDVGKRLSAAAALESTWVREGGCAPDTPLEGTVVQRLQRHATYGHLKQLVRLVCLRGSVHCNALERRNNLTAPAAGAEEACHSGAPLHFPGSCYTCDARG